MTESNRDVSRTIEALLSERRNFPPSEEVSRRALVSSPSIYGEGERSEEFWARQAEAVVWRRRWNQVLDWSKAPFAR
jgi:acetyl-CoA synthetase